MPLIQGFQWSTCGKHVTKQTYPFACNGGSVQSTNIIRGAADLSQLQRTGSFENGVPPHKAGASGKQTVNHTIMGVCGCEGDI